MAAQRALRSVSNQARFLRHGKAEDNRLNRVGITMILWYLLPLSQNKLSSVLLQAFDKHTEQNQNHLSTPVSEPLSHYYCTHLKTHWVEEHPPLVPCLSYRFKAFMWFLCCNRKMLPHSVRLSSNFQTNIKIIQIFYRQMHTYLGDFFDRLLLPRFRDIEPILFLLSKGAIFSII